MCGGEEDFLVIYFTQIKTPFFLGSCISVALNDAHQFHCLSRRLQRKLVASRSYSSFDVNQFIFFKCISPNVLLIKAY